MSRCLSLFSGGQAEKVREGARGDPRKALIYSMDNHIQFGKWNIHSDSRGSVGGRGGMGELRAEVTGREAGRGTDQNGWVFTNCSAWCSGKEPKMEWGRSYLGAPCPTKAPPSKTRFSAASLTP